jgi:uncharacterized SAM-binding protein YcdF (DUF218 family)
MRHMEFSKQEKDYIVAGMESKGDFSAGVKRSSRLVRWIKAMAVLAVAGIALGTIGFFGFSALVNGGTDDDIGSADAIVVLTGGEARIPEAVRLLAEGKGRRLLISGVNPVTTKGELASLMPNSKKWFRCCIDVDQVARDTIGNANETRVWVEKRGFKSLVVVTASYHMPRSLAELRRALPDVEFIPYPVKPKNLHLESWWTHGATFQLLATEYVKFIPSYARCVLVEIGRRKGIQDGARQCLNDGIAG